MEQSATGNEGIALLAGILVHQLYKSKVVELVFSGYAVWVTLTLALCSAAQHADVQHLHQPQPQNCSNRHGCKFTLGQDHREIAQTIGAGSN